MCRLWHRYKETTDYMISGCAELEKSEYIFCHDKIASYIHWNICKEYSIKVADNSNNRKWKWNMCYHLGHVG